MNADSIEHIADVSQGVDFQILARRAQGVRPVKCIYKIA